ncbi:MAG: GIY-YIG nuclease family protein [Methylococcales bacterium]|nr:GIY-YIG nuclease family protein [Methylococcales bacterium]MBT7445717.1 GIY-YIG nuclease family protein [Methylococcales bacterium]
MVWSVYILECADGSLYTGIAKDVEARLAKHNSGKGARYTRGRLPVFLKYSETVETHGEALKREYQIKQVSRQGKLALIATNPL